MQDIRFGLRMLARSPGVTAIAVLSLAVGIGANITVFSIVNSTLLRPLPVRGPDRLVSFYHHSPRGEHMSFSYPEYEELRALDGLFAGVAAYSAAEAVLSAGDEPEGVAAEVVTPGYFEVAGARIAMGRSLAESGRDAVVISEALWKRRLGGDPGVLGRVVRLNGQPFTIAGVAGGGFAGVEPGVRTDVWAPLAAHNIVMPWGGGTPAAEVERLRLASRGAQWMALLARLAPGVSVRQAQAAAAAMGARTGENRTLGVSPAGRGALTPGARREVAERMLLILAITLLVLLSACANVGNLLLARASARRREFAIRLAVGAGRWRLARQFLVESMLLAAAAGAVALLAAMWTPALLGWVPLPGGWSVADLNVAPDARLCGFALLLAVIAGLLFGLAPAWRAARSAELSPGRETGRYLSGGLRGALVVVQVSLSLALLVAAGLLARSLGNRVALNPGFAHENLLLVHFQPGGERDRAEQARREFLERVRRVPGVQAAAWSGTVPLDVWRMKWGGSTVEGATADLEGTAVGSGYFTTMRIALVEGRDFSDADERSENAVALVNESMAQRFWPGASAVGRSFVAGRRRYTIIGVARDSRHRDLRSLLGSGGPFIYVNAMQSPPHRMTLLVRTAAPPAPMAAALGREARAVSPDAPPLAVRTAREHVNQVFAQERAAALLTGILGLIGLLLAAAGIYAVAGYQVEERTREIGLRMALGAQPGQALRLMLRRSAALAGAGVAIGLAIAFLGGKIMAGMLFGVSPGDAATFVPAAALLAAVALAASWIPARRAARVDPAITLRHE